MKKIFKWIDKGGKEHEYRFTDNICDGFFSSGVEAYQEQKYKGKELTEIWEENLISAGFNCK